jgi:tRNA pseudouridine55 synthase
MNGFVIVDKPAGCTSHDVVNVWRRLSRSRRVGHLGTLDPMATGVLVLAVGSATRLAQFYTQQTKTYEGEIDLGVVSGTYDADGEVQPTGIEPPPLAEVIAALDRFRGRIQQMPPPVSAKKIRGVPAYKLARKNIEVDLKPVEVEISELEVLQQTPGRIKIRVSCSAGTYVRSLAHDLGQTLGCGAILSSLRRQRSGDFEVDQAHSLDKLRALAAEGRLEESVIPASALLPQFPTAHVDSTLEAQIRQGREFRVSPFAIKPGSPFVKAVSQSGDLIAIGELRIPNLYHPAVVL